MCILQKWTASASLFLAYQYIDLANLERASSHLKEYNGIELPGKSLFILCILFFFSFLLNWTWQSTFIPNWNWFNWYNIRDEFQPWWLQLHQEGPLVLSSSLGWLRKLKTPHKEQCFLKLCHLKVFTQKFERCLKYGIHFKFTSENDSQALLWRAQSVLPTFFKPLHSYEKPPGETWTPVLASILKQNNVFRP